MSEHDTRRQLDADERRAEAEIRAAVLAERARCKLVVQMNQCRCGFACGQAGCDGLRGRFSVKMLDEIDSGKDYSSLVSARPHGPEEARIVLRR